jgi:hypothetical protein
MAKRVAETVLMLALLACGQTMAQTFDTEDLKLPVPGVSGSFPAAITYAIDAGTKDVAQRQLRARPS